MAKKISMATLRPGDPDGAFEVAKQFIEADEYGSDIAEMLLSMQEDRKAGRALQARIAEFIQERGK